MGRQSDIDRNEVVKEYGIKFRPYLAKSQWPISLQNLISSVQKLVNQSYDGWREDLHCDKNRPWRTEIQARAENLSQLALQSKRDCRELNEEDWRMRLEPEVFKRFDREVNCHICTGRLWRSFVEVDPSSAALFDRQNRRTVCHCDRDKNGSSMILNRIFGSRTEPIVKYDTAVLEKLGRIYEKPDRMCGLRRVGRIEENMFRKDIRRNGGGRTLQMQLRSSLIERDSICLFPFLVFEAKGTYGEPRSYVENQTAFAVRESLLIQEELQNSPGATNQDPDPCVWCMSQRGETWEISLAYLVQNRQVDDGYGVNVIRLWDGDVCILDDALRLLLIMDFIFDWARDEYREKVIRQLHNLVSEPNAPGTAIAFPSCSEPTVISVADDEVGIGHYVAAFREHSAAWVRSTASQVDVPLDDKQTKILAQVTESLRIGRREEIQSWNLDVSADETCNPVAQLPMSFDALRKHDSQQCAFRDATLIRSRVMGLFITEDNVDALFRCKSQDHQSITLLRHIVTKLEKEDLLILRGDIITAIEQAWAGYNKDQPEMKDPSENFYVLLTFSAYIGSDWEQVRELSYLAVSTKALKPLCQLARRAIRFYSVRCDVELVMSIVEVFLRASISANLTACLYRISMTPYFVDEQHDDNIFKDKSNLRPCVMLQTNNRRARDLIWDMYKGNRIGRLEPSVPYLRVSSRLDKQDHLATAPRARDTGAPWTTYTIADPLVLSYNKNPSTVEGPEWGLFLVRGVESRNLILSLAQDDNRLRRAYNTYRLGLEPGWRRVCWNNTGEYDEQAGLSRVAKRFAKHLASALFNDKYSAEGSDADEESHDGHSLFSGQSSYYDSGSSLNLTSSGYESDDTLQEGYGFVGCDSE